MGRAVTRTPKNSDMRRSSSSCWRSRSQAWVMRSNSRPAPGGRRPRLGGRAWTWAGGGQGGGAFVRPPMTVELAAVSRPRWPRHHGGRQPGRRQTVEVVSKVSGRLQSVNVRIGDPVAQAADRAGRDSEIREQVKQAAASHAVARPRSGSGGGSQVLRDEPGAVPEPVQPPAHPAADP